MSFRRILVPVDLTAGTAASLEYVIGMAKATAGEVTLFHVYELPMVLVEVTPRGALKEISAKLRKQKLQQLQKLKSHPSVPPGVKIEIEVIEGSLAREIPARAAHGDHDLVVIAASRKSTVSSIFGTSLVENLARELICPLLVLKSGVEDRAATQRKLEVPGTLEAPRVERVLYPTDLSSASLRSLEFAIALSRDFEARLDVVHVFEKGIGLPWEFLSVRNRDELEQRCRQRLEEAVEEHAHGLDWVGARLVTGDPAASIISLSADDGYDMIIMASHGRTGLSRLVLGSVAARVLRKVGCPVLLAPLAKTKK